MHILLTDRLACPRCGPNFGLILLAGLITERRVVDGTLACANCREGYPIKGGFADLRPGPGVEKAGAERPPLAPEGLKDPGGRDDPDQPVRGGDAIHRPEKADLAALLGMARGPGYVLVVGSGDDWAPQLADAIEDIEVIAAHAAPRKTSEAERVSRIAVGGRLPFLTGQLSGIVLEGELGAPLIREAVRAVAPGSRLVFLRPSSQVSAALNELELDVLIDSEEALVGARK